jgi:hypothetical protein
MQAFYERDFATTAGLYVTSSSVPFAMFPEEV